MCKNRDFRTLVDTAKHFESGSCEGCLGQANARRFAYDQLANSAGGERFLARPAQLTWNGDVAEGGYSASGQNYKCPGCGKLFSLLSSLLEHQQNRRECLLGGSSQANVRLQIGHNPSQGERLRLYHGTTWEQGLPDPNQPHLPDASTFTHPRATFLHRLPLQRATSKVTDLPSPPATWARACILQEGTRRGASHEIARGSVVRTRVACSRSSPQCIIPST